MLLNILRATTEIIAFFGVVYLLMGLLMNKVCPRCHAARNVRCLESVKDGSKFVDYFHPERLTAHDVIDGFCRDCGKSYVACSTVPVCLPVPPLHPELGGIIRAE